MTDLLEEFFQASDFPGMMDLARALSARDDPADVPGLQKALSDPLEARRYAAVYAMGFSRRDGRAVSPLIRVLENRQETPQIRAQAAECLGMVGKRKAIRALIQCSTDESAEVRFWCVFAMGQYSWGHRGRKRPLSVVSALEARLSDGERPDDRGNYWAAGLEALAMLRGAGARHTATRLFRETMQSVLRDPLNHRERWQWAASYWNPSEAFAGIDGRIYLTQRFGRSKMPASIPSVLAADEPGSFRLEFQEWASLNPS
jgi:hypothetical protein